MRNLSVLGCIVALCASSGCQSGSTGFRNPFKGQFARTFPNSSPELATRSKELREEDRSLLDLDEGAGETSTADTRPASHSRGTADMRSGSQQAELELLQERADAEFTAGNLQQAAGMYRELIGVNPQDARSYHRLAIIHDQQQDFAAAEQHYKSALRIEPDNASILNDLGYSYYLQHRYEDSKAYLQSILRIDRENSLAMRNLALVHAAEGDVQRAFALFQQGGLKPEQSQQQIQLAIAHAGEGKATTRENNLGIASTNSEPPANTSMAGVASVGNTVSQPASEPGHSEIRSARGGAFQPQPDWDSAYGMSAHHTPGKVDPSAQPVHSAAFTGSRETSPMVQQHAVAHQEYTGNSPVQHVSYSPSNQRQGASATEANLIRTALNTGYGNLFPVISTEEYNRVQHAGATAEAFNTADARTAYYEEFGQPGSSTPHVVHANSVRSVSGDKPASGSVRQASYEQPRVLSNGSSRIQTPSYESGRVGSETQPGHSNSFPVTQPTGSRTSEPDYYQFPKQERPPFEEPQTESSNTSPHVTEKYLHTTEQIQEPPFPVEMLNPDKHIVFTPRSHNAETPSDDTPPTIPMSEEAKKAHEIALEQYRRAQQQP